MSDAYVESKPPISADTVLSRNQIRYCLFQRERLGEMRAYSQTNIQIDHFNDFVDDWNAHCSSYRYDERDMRAVNHEIVSQLSRLKAEGRRLVRVDVPTGPPARTASAATPNHSLTSEQRLLDPIGSRSDAAIIQSRLAALGFYRQAVDGIWGAGSRRALTEFQRSVGLRADAVWNRQTQARLFAGSSN